MEIVFPHEVIFSNHQQVSVSDVASSLLANEQILLSIGRVLENCFEGLTVEKIKVDFRYASINSPLREALSAGILLTFQQQLTTEVPKMIETLTGLHIADDYKSIVTIVFLATTLYGIERAWAMFKGPQKTEEGSGIPVQIQNNFGSVIMVGGEMLGVEPARLDSAVRKSFSPKQIPHLAKSALAFIQPAKREPGAGITGGGVSIDAATIEEAPSAIDVALDDDEEMTTPIEKVEVVIHATDIDHSASGWAGHIPGVWERRLRMKLFPSIQPSRLFAKDKIVADVILVAKRHPNGEYVPYLIHIVNVYD